MIEIDEDPRDANWLVEMARRRGTGTPPPSLPTVTEAAAASDVWAYPGQPRDGQGRFGRHSGGGVGLGVSRERPDLGGGDVHTYGDVETARKNPVIAAAERTTTADLRKLGVDVDSQTQVAGVFEGGGEPSLVVKLGKASSVEDIDVAGAYMVRRNQQDSVIVNVTGDEMKRLGLQPNGTLVRVEGLPTDHASREQIFADIQEHTPFASWDEKSGRVEVSSFSADLDPGMKAGLASLAAAHGARLTTEPTHTRWYFHDEETRSGAQEYLHPADTSVLRTPAEVRSDYPGPRTDAIPAPRPGSSGSDVGGSGAAGQGGSERLDLAARAVPEALVAYSPGQKRDTVGRFGSGGGHAPSGSSDTGVPSQERLDEVGAELADPANHGRDYETSVILKADGSEAMRLSQKQESFVDFDAGAMVAAKDATVIHNHPGGTALSSLDVKLAGEADVASIHAYGTVDTPTSREKVRFSLYRPEAGWKRGRLESAVDQATRETRDKFGKRIAAAGGDPAKTRAAIEDANQQHSGEVMRRTVELYNNRGLLTAPAQKPTAKEQVHYEEGTW